MRDDHLRADRLRAAGPGAERFGYAEWVADDFARLDGAQTIRYEEEPDPARPQKRLIEQSRTFYRATI